MNKTYCKDNKKDRFIGNYLLPYLLKRIKDSEEPEVTIDNVASMYIFPYQVPPLCCCFNKVYA